MGIAGSVVESERERHRDEGPIRVVVIDDHRMLVDALAMLLDRQPDIRLAGTATEGVSGYELCERIQPDVALVDVDLPDESGVTVTREISRRSPKTKVVVIAALADDDVVVRAVESGAVGFVPKVSAIERLLDVIRAAATGSIVLPDDRHDEILQRISKRPRAGSAGSEAELTPDERAVLASFALGSSRADIAAELAVPDDVIEAHVTSIVTKLGARSLLDAVLLGLRRGLVSLDRPA